MDKNIILLTNGILARYKFVALQYAMKAGWEPGPHIIALRGYNKCRCSQHQDLVATTHPANWLTESLFEKYFG